jgi:hypothetical protein
MSGVVAALSMGLVLGLQHATDSDHVVAVTTVVARERRIGAAARIGVLWGLGHSATVLVLGGAMVATGVVISARSAQALEMCVAAMLVALGAAGLRRAFAAQRLASNHDHARPATTASGSTFRASLRPLTVGVVHGLAGSAAIALAVLATIQQRTTALGYLATFSFGTIVGMSLVTALISTPIAVATKRVDPKWLVRLGAVAGLASIGFGLWMAYDIGVVDGLLFRHAQAAPP